MPIGLESDESVLKHPFQRLPVECSRRPHGQAASAGARRRQMPLRTCPLRSAPAKPMAACAGRVRPLLSSGCGKSLARPFIAVDDRLRSEFESRETGICSADPAREGPAEANHAVTRSPGRAGESPLCGANATFPIADFSHRTLTPGLSQAYVRITPRLIGTVVKRKSPRRCVGKRVLRGLEGPAAHLRLSDARCLLPHPGARPRTCSRRIRRFRPGTT